MHRTPRVMHDARPPTLHPPPALSTPIRGGLEGCQEDRSHFRTSAARPPRGVSSSSFSLARLPHPPPSNPPLPSYFSSYYTSVSSSHSPTTALLLRAASLRLVSLSLLPPPTPGLSTESTKCKPLAPFPTTHRGSPQSSPDALQWRVNVLREPEARTNFFFFSKPGT